MKNAATFEIPVGGDLQAYNGNIVYFNAVDGNSTAMGWTLRRDTLALWNIKKHQFCPMKKPWFERGTLFGQFLKQR